MKFSDGVEIDLSKEVRREDWKWPGTWIALDMEDTESGADYGPSGVRALLTANEARQFAAELLRLADEVEREGQP